MNPEDDCGEHVTLADIRDSADFKQAMVGLADILADSPQKLCEVAQTLPFAAEPCIEELQTGLEEEITDNSQDSIEAMSGGLFKHQSEYLNSLVNLAPDYPTAVNEARSLFYECLTIEHGMYRRDALRGLVMLAVHTDADSRQVAEEIVDELHEDGDHQLALWGLVTLSIGDSGVIEHAAERLPEILTHSSNDSAGVEEAAVRRLAAEALAIHSDQSANLIGDPPVCEGPTEESAPANAAWAIQRVLDKQELPLTDRDAIISDPAVSPHYGLVDTLVETLVRASGEENDLAFGATLALGYIVPGGGRYREVIGHLAEASTRDGKVADAAEWVLTNGPFSEYQEGDPEVTTDHRVEIKLAPVEAEYSCPRTAVPEDILTRGDGEANAVEIVGNERIVHVVESTRFPGDAEMELADQSRRAIGAEYGETVSVRPVDLPPARRVTVALPEQIALSCEMVDPSKLRAEFRGQAATEGGVLFLDLREDRGETDLKAEDVTSAPDAVHVSKRLPFQVTDLCPAERTVITVDTPLQIEGQQGRPETENGSNDTSAGTSRTGEGT